jgi:hypothetical protein
MMLPLDAGVGLCSVLWCYSSQLQVQGNSWSMPLQSDNPTRQACIATNAASSTANNYAN